MCRGIGIAARERGGGREGERGTIACNPAKLGAWGRRGDRAVSHRRLRRPLGGGSPPQGVNYERGQLFGRALRADAAAVSHRLVS